MQYSYLLDTNILSNLIRYPNGTIFFKIKEVGEANICTSIIVACELAFGAEKKQSKRLQERVNLILDLVPIVPMLAGMEKVYGEIRAILEHQGTPIGGNDLLIASQAIYANLILVTDNTGEFKRMPGLSVENWL